MRDRKWLHLDVDHLTWCRASSGLAFAGVVQQGKGLDPAVASGLVECSLWKGEILIIQFLHLFVV